MLNWRGVALVTLVAAAVIVGAMLSPLPGVAGAVYMWGSFAFCVVMVGASIARLVSRALTHE